MRWLVAVGLILAAATGCHPDEPASSAPSDDALSAAECDWRRAPEPGDADEPPCDIEFREVVRLEGDLDGVIPQYPVTVLRDGRYVTATYSRGRLALWAPNGEFLDVMGNGPGEGPGEFDNGAVITGISTIAGARGFVLRGDSIGEMGLLGRPRSFLLLAAADDIGVWSAEHDRYVLRRHSWPGGAVVDSVVPARDWFPDREDNVAQLGRLHADGRGLVWTVSGVADPDAPSGSWPPRNEVAFDSEEFQANNDKYRDTVIEAFAPDGRLVASIRFDSALDSPDPVHGSVWFRPTEDLLTFVIVEAVLIQPSWNRPFARRRYYPPALLLGARHPGHGPG